MALFTIGDLHLSLGTSKPMDVFSGWNNYVNRLQEAWEQNISNDDTTVIIGDVSWAMKLEECVQDFSFINNLPGKKIILKGNHDYWWSTLSKMNAFLEQSKFDTISVLNNNCFYYNELAICGTRGWMLDETCEHDEKITSREAGRLEASLQAAQGHEKIAFLHYPPIYKGQISENIMNILHKYNVETCFYGHLHGAGIYGATQGEYDGINFKLVSADALQFSPHKICN